MERARSVFGCFALAVVVALSLLTGIAGNAYAMTPVYNQTALFEKRFDYGDNPVHYIYRLGYGYENYGSYADAQSWMYIKNTNRTVGHEAIMSQAGLTRKNIANQTVEVIYGPAIWSQGDNPPGNVVESNVSRRMYSGNGNTYAWGNGFVRDPLSEYHHVGINDVYIFNGF